MVNVRDRLCQAAGCPTVPSFGVRGSGSAGAKLCERSCLPHHRLMGATRTDEEGRTESAAATSPWSFPRPSLCVSMGAAPGAPRRLRLQSVKSARVDVSASVNVSDGGPGDVCPLEGLGWSGSGSESEGKSNSYSEWTS